MISLLIPTRNRPVKLGQVISSARMTASQPDDLEFCLYLDDDDPGNYKDLFGREDVKYKIGPRITLSAMWNECFKIATGDILMQGNDDIVFRTAGWDGLVRNAFQGDKIRMVHGGDGGPRGEVFGPHPFISREWVETVGYFTPPYFSSDFGDSWINDLANRIGRRTYVPILVEHMHHFFGKAEMDQTTNERLARHSSDNVDALYHALAALRQIDAARLSRRIAGMTTESMKWSILILTQPSRAGFLARLLSVLEPQVEKFPDVEICVRLFDKSMDLGTNRSEMIKQAKGAYVNFVDDDDLVPPVYVEHIYPLLNKDYVGFRVQMDIDGVDQKPTYHSLKYKEWNGDSDGWYRDISHVNPIRRSIAIQVPMRGGHGEDARWAQEVRNLHLVRTENYLPEIMYYYHFRSNKQDQPATPGATWGPDLLRYDPNYYAVGHRRPVCPRCSSNACGIAGGMRICNQCGATWT